MQKNKKTTTIIAICVAVAVLIVGGVAAFLLFSKHQRETSTVTVSLDMQIQGYEAQTGSGVPVCVDGTDYNGSPVSGMILIDGSVSGVELHNGNYELRVAGSPVNGDGGIYEVPSKTYAISVDGDDVVIDGEKSQVGSGAVRSVQLPRMDFAAIEPDSVTDAQIEAVRAWMQEYGLSTDRIDEFVSLIQKARADAVKRKEAAALEAWRTKLSGQFYGTGGDWSRDTTVNVYFDGDKVTVKGNLERVSSDWLTHTRLDGNEWHFMLTDSTEYCYFADERFSVSRDYFRENFLPNRFPGIEIEVQDGYVKQIVASP